MKNKALFLDRDGVVNIDKGYIYKIEDFTFIKDIFNVVLEYQEKGYKIFIVTNQSGIARGFYTLKDYQILTDWMLEQFREKGIYITKVYYCPHYPEISGICQCRKPNPGMIIDAINEFNIDPAQSVLIGDNERDIEAGKRAGIKKNIYFHTIKIDNF